MLASKGVKIDSKIIILLRLNPWQTLYHFTQESMGDFEDSCWRQNKLREYSDIRLLTFFRHVIILCRKNKYLLTNFSLCTTTLTQFRRSKCLEKWNSFLTFYRVCQGFRLKKARLLNPILTIFEGSSSNWGILGICKNCVESKTKPT